MKGADNRPARPTKACTRPPKTRAAGDARVVSPPGGARKKVAWRMIRRGAEHAEFKEGFLCDLSVFAVHPGFWF